MIVCIKEFIIFDIEYHKKKKKSSLDNKIRLQHLG